jgi:hypothetical protein
MPVILKPCAFSSTKSLSEYQAVNDPKKPLRLAEEVNTSLQEFQKRASPPLPLNSSCEEITKAERIKKFHVYRYDQKIFT